MVEGSLVVRLLGDLEVVRDGEVVVLPRSRRTRALLAFLVTTGKPERRERLCDLLWDGPDDPRAALRWSLTKIRPLVDAPGRSRIVSDRERAGFDVRDTVVDAHAFRAALAAPAAASALELQESLALVRGEFLAGLEIPQCYAWNSWLAVQREEFRQLQQQGLAALVGKLRDRPAEALVAARRRTALDPFDEDARASVIEILGTLCRPREVRAEYELVERLIQQEFHRRPGERLEAARRSAEERCRTMEGTLPPPPLTPAAIELAETQPPSSPRARPAQSRQGSLLGRGAVLEQLIAASGMGRPPVSGAPRCVLVAGEPGIGKSRLLEELALTAQANGMVVFQGRAYEAEMVRPYGPWTDALRPVVRDLRATPLPHASLPHVLARLGVLLDDGTLRGELSPTSREDGGADGTDSSLQRQRLFDAVIDLLQLLGESGRLPLLVLDDLQWFDDASMALAHYIMRMARQSLLLAASARTAALSSNPSAAGFVRSLRREGRLEEMRLEPLASADIIDLVRDLAPATDVTRVAQLADGNPLFAIEIARNVACGQSTLPASLDAVIEDHLARLEDTTRDLVPWAAAFGTSFDPELLGRVSGLSDADLDAALHELELHEVIRPSSGSAEYDFTHDLVRQVAYRQLTPPRARAIHRTIASHLAELDDRRGVCAGDLARHAQLGGDLELAARACLRAGDRCLRLFALHDARTTAERGLELLAGTSLDQTERLSLQGDLLRVLVHAGGGRKEPLQMQRRLEAFTEEANRAGQPALVQAAYYLASFIHFQGEDWAHAATDTLRAFDAGRAADAETAVRSMANTGRCLATIERELLRATELLDEARSSAAGLQLELIDVAWGNGVMAQYTGDNGAAIRELTRTAELGQQHGEHWPVCDALLRLACMAHESGDYEGAIRWCAALAPMAARLGEASEGPLGDAIAALARLSLGVPDDRPSASDALQRALDALVELDAKGARGYALLLKARLAVAEGDTGEARRCAVIAMEAAAAIGRPSLEARARVLLATLALDADQVSDAIGLMAPVAALVEAPLALSATARREYEALRARISTQTPTLAATQPSQV